MANLNEKTLFILGRDPYAQGGMPSFAKAEQTEAALWLKDSRKDPERSDAASYEAEIREGGAILNFRMDCDEPERNAIVVEGGTAIVMEPDIHLSGPGCSDFTCKGTGVLAEEGARVDVRGGQIITDGATRSATIATTGATLKVFDCRLETHGGPLPDWYKPVIGPGMMEPPYPLGLGGNCRTHLSMDNSESYFYNCDIFADAWAALSTDSSGGYVYLEATDCRINVAGNGYVTYADNGCHVYLRHCEMNSGNVFVIQDGDSSVQLGNCTGTAKGYGFLIHGGLPDLRDIGTIRLTDCDLLSAGPMFKCKSTNVDLYVKGGRLTCTKGVILETMLTDDDHYAKNRTQGPDQYGVQVTFEDVELFGDLRCDDPERKNVVSFVGTELTGGITGYPTLNLTAHSSWTATKESFVTVASAEGIDAAKGVTIHAKSQALPAGTINLPSGGVLEIEE